MKDFKQYAQRTTEQLKEQSLAYPRRVGCEIKYLDDSKLSKKDLAIEIAQRNGIHDGLICLLTAVEPCQTFSVRRCRQTKTIALEKRPGGVLRLETPIHRPEEFKVWRTKENDPDGPMQWLRMRRGVADLHRRAEVSQASNQRFATALGAVLENESVRLKDLAASLCTRVIQPARPKPDGTRTRPRSFRALNPLNPDDIRLLTIVSKTEFVMNGLRNADVRLALYGEDPADATERRRRSSRVSRLLALLRAHGILRKVCKSHHYRVTKKGRTALTALLAAANANTTELTNLAA